MSMSDELERLTRLRDAGALSEAEFLTAKARVLSDKPFTTEARSHSLLHELRRSRTDRILGGVCGGLGQYTGLPAWTWRVLFCLTMLSFGFGLLLYALLWLFIPLQQGASVN